MPRRIAPSDYDTFADASALFGVEFAMETTRRPHLLHPTQRIVVRLCLQASSHARVFEEPSFWTISLWSPVLLRGNGWLQDRVNAQWNHAHKFYTDKLRRAGTEVSSSKVASA